MLEPVARENDHEKVWWVPALVAAEARVEAAAREICRYFLQFSLSHAKILI